MKDKQIGMLCLLFYSASTFLNITTGLKKRAYAILSPVFEYNNYKKSI